MGSTGIRVSSSVKLVPVGGKEKISDFESRGLDTDAFGEGKNNEYAVLFDKDGNPVVGYLGDKHSVAVDNRAMNMEGGTLTHRHPDNSFGGTLSMTDLKLLAQSKLGEIRAFSKQGQLYSVKANEKADRAKLLNWVNSHQKAYQTQFENAYKRALKGASTPLKSGPHKGMVKIEKGRANGKMQYSYVKPMTPQQADRYARQYSVGRFERAYKKSLTKFGFTYTKTKAKGK